jgi:hypothetical protein
MNAILFGAISFGLMVVTLSPQPDQAVLIHAPAPPEQAIEMAAAEPALPATRADLAAIHAEHDAEVARLMEAAPDVGFAGDIVITDPETGEQTEAQVLAFED